MDRKVFVCLALTLLVAAACGRRDGDGTGVQGTRQELVLEAGVYGMSTRAAVSGASVPENYTIHLSSSISSSEGGTVLGDYFTGVTFHKDGSFWYPEEPVLWPLGCTLDFLGIAVDHTAAGFDPSPLIRWNSRCCTDGFTLDVPDSATLDTEVLFASLSGAGIVEGYVPLEFRHSQAWLQFRVSSSSPCLSLESLTVLDVYSGGLLTVSEADPVDPSRLLPNWNFRGRVQRDYSLPEVSGQRLEEEPLVFNLLLPWQPRRDLEVTVGFRSDPSDEELLSVKTYRLSPPAGWWYDGEKYVYDMDVSAGSAMELVPVVTAWDDVPQTVTLPEPVAATYRVDGETAVTLPEAVMASRTETVVDWGDGTVEVRSYGTGDGGDGGSDRLALSHVYREEYTGGVSLIVRRGCLDFGAVPTDVYGRFIVKNAARVRVSCLTP